MEEFPDKQLLMIRERPWFADMANYKVARIILVEFNGHQKKKFLKDATSYIWDDPYLFKLGSDNLLRRHVSKEEAQSIVWHCHNPSYREHDNGEKIVTNIFQFDFY